MFSRKKERTAKQQDMDIMEEIRRLNEVAKKYSEMGQELNEMENKMLLQTEENENEPQLWTQISEEVKNVRERIKMVKGDISMADLEVRGVVERLEGFKHKRGGKLWRILAAVELVLLVAGAVFLLPGPARESANNPAGIENENTGDTNVTSEGELPKQEPQTAFYSENLKARVAEIKREEIEPFLVTVEEIDGLEHLCFTAGELRIAYANEYFLDEENATKQIKIKNAKRQVAYEWNYDLRKSLSRLAPKYDSYTGEEGNQLIFLMYDKDDEKVPGTIRMLDAEKLWEFEPFDFNENLLNLFTMEYSERAATDGGVSSTFMEMVFGTVPYTYSIEQSTYVNAVYYGENPLLFQKYFSLQLSEEKMSFEAVVYTQANEFLGEITGEIATVDREVVLKNVRFGAYVTPYQEDVTSDGIIVPRSTRMTEHITISGKHRERYYIALSDEIARVDYDMDRLIMNEKGFYEYFNEAGEKISYTGIDVSKYQGEIDWKKVKAAGVDFAIIRLGYRGMKEGTLELDPYYERNVKAAAAAGIQVGVYFFSQAITTQEAVEEAQMVLKYIEGKEITYPVIFDTEVVTTYAARANNIPRDLRTDICIAFCETIFAAGYRPMIYANTQWFILGVDMERLTDYDKWYAYYGTNFTFPYHYDMLQYSDKGSVPGINGNVDLDISFVDYSKYSR